MPSDDPLSVIKQLNQSDERQRSPVLRFRKPLVAILKLISDPVTATAIELADRLLAGRAESNISEFLDLLEREVRANASLIEEIREQSERQQQFVRDELPALAVEALSLAERCRSQERLRRLASILAGAIGFGAEDGADAIEDMLATATRLSDSEVSLLHHTILENDRESAQHPGEAARALAERAWAKAVAKLPGTTQDEWLTKGSKLESFGLVTRVETGTPWAPPVFRPLDAGRRFIAYIRRQPPR